jgi:hypothetical protein
MGPRTATLVRRLGFQRLLPSSSLLEEHVSLLMTPNGLVFTWARGGMLPEDY